MELKLSDLDKFSDDDLRTIYSYVTDILIRRGVIKKPTYTIEAKQSENKNAYRRWTPEEDQLLIEAYQRGAKVKQLAEHFGRKPNAISSRLNKLGLHN